MEPPPSKEDIEIEIETLQAGNRRVRLSNSAHPSEFWSPEDAKNTSEILGSRRRHILGVNSCTSNIKKVDFVNRAVVSIPL